MSAPIGNQSPHRIYWGMTGPEIVEMMLNPKHEKHEEWKAWLGPPPQTSIKQINDLLWRRAEHIAGPGCDPWLCLQTAHNELHYGEE